MCRIGFLTYKKHHTLESLPYFYRLAKVAKALGMRLYAFSIDDLDVQRKTVRAVIGKDATATKASARSADMIPTTQTIAWPDIFYDFVRYHPTKQFARYLKLRAQNILPSLYRGGSNKWRQYEILSQHENLIPHLPKTIRWQHTLDISKIMTLFSGQPVLIKPIHGTGGKGILAVEHADGHIFNNLSDVIIQEKLDLKFGDRLYDTRVLVQKNTWGRWTVTGLGTRSAPNTSLVTNLSRGGTALRTEHFLQNIAHLPVTETLQAIERLSLNVAETLDASFGPLVELGLDIAITRDAHLYLLEANTKPDRMILLKTGQKEAFVRAHARPLLYLCEMFTSGNLRAYR